MIRIYHIMYTCNWKKIRIIIGCLFSSATVYFSVVTGYFFKPYAVSMIEISSTITLFMSYLLKINLFYLELNIHTYFTFHYNEFIWKNPNDKSFFRNISTVLFTQYLFFSRTNNLENLLLISLIRIPLQC